MSTIEKILTMVFVCVRHLTCHHIRGSRIQSVSEKGRAGSTMEMASH